jgi:magnesium-transporting ATPase (P-type)
MVAQQVNRVAVVGGCKVMCFDKTGTITEDGLSFSGVRPVVRDVARDHAHVDRIGPCIACDVHSSSPVTALGVSYLFKRT